MFLHRRFANFKIFKIGIICEFAVKSGNLTFQTLSLLNQIYGHSVYSGLVFSTYSELRKSFDRFEDQILRRIIYLSAR